MKKLFFPALFASALLLFIGCASSGQDAAVAVIGSERITVKDFEDAFSKNNGGWEKGVAASMEERGRFLELLIKFRLKVQEARSRGLLRDSSIQQELKSYGTSIATSYMLDKELVEPNIKKMFDRKQDEVRASHILIRLSPNPTPDDTAAAYKKAMELIGLVPTMPFDSLVVLYSGDESAVMNRGDLGFFSGGRMVPEFEEAAYRMAVGEYTRVPARTQFGYHIIKITDRRTAPGPVRISHVLRRFAQTLEDTTAVKDSVWTIYKEINAGLDFSKAAQQYSQDPSTAARGGDLGFFERSRLPEHIGVLFYETPIGGVTEPMRFPYGYHIFKVIERKPAPTFAELERDLRNQYQNGRYTADYQNYIHDLKRKFYLNHDVKTLYDFSHALDSTKTPSAAGWSDTLRADFLRKNLLTLATVSYSVGDVVEFVSASQEFKSILLTATNIETIVERFTEIKVLEEEAKDVPRRHPNFDRLMDEYEDGVLLFRIEQDEVWNKVVATDSALRLYYEQHKENYRWPDRVNVQEILVNTDSVAKAAYWKVQQGADFGEVAAENSMRPTMQEKRGVQGLLPVETRDITKKAWTMAVDSVSAPFQANEGWAIIKVLQKDSARTKAFEEVQAEITSAYREYASKLREQEWFEELKNKYGVKIDKESLTEAFRRKSGETP